MAAAARMSAVYGSSTSAYATYAANISGAMDRKSTVFLEIGKFASASKTLNDEAETISSVQAFCEVVVLLIIVLAFAVVGISCLGRVKLLLQKGGHDAAALTAGRQIRSQILGTTATIFVTFLLRSVFAIMDAVSGALSDSFNSCSGNTAGLCNSTCYNIHTHMESWMARTPEFRVSITLISFPISLLVALWGMTSGLMRRLIHRRSESMRAGSEGSSKLEMTR
jgi:hypothetical protein